MWSVGQIVEMGSDFEEGDVFARPGLQPDYTDSQLTCGSYSMLSFLDLCLSDSKFDTGARDFSGLLIPCNTGQCSGWSTKDSDISEFSTPADT
jgi:hypothetical protein